VTAELVVVSDARALARRAAERIVELTRACVKARGACSVALAGGSTPRATYEVLATWIARRPALVPAALAAFAAVTHVAATEGMRARPAGPVVSIGS